MFSAIVSFCYQLRFKIGVIKPRKTVFTIVNLGHISFVREVVDQVKSDRLILVVADRIEFN